MMTTHTPLRSTTVAIATIALTLPVIASAHVGADGAAHHGFGAGFLHPFGGIDHLVAAMAAGFRATTAGRPWSLVLTYLVALVAGALLAAGGVAPPAIEPVLAASVLVLGIAIALPSGLRTQALLALTACFATYHGAAHSIELPASGFAGIAGMVAATALLLGAGAALGRFGARAGNRARRAAGAGTAALGSVLLVSALARL